MDRFTQTRRVRYAPPEPRVSRLNLTEPDFAIFEAIERHGPLPSSYLYGFTKHLRRDRTHLQNRLTDFFNGDARGTLLTRPSQQFASFAARYQHLVYDLTRRAQTLLAERGSLVSRTLPRTDPFVHRLMASCLGASFELGAGKHGLRYISCDDILSKRPRENLRLAVHPLALVGPAIVIPDFAFGLEYPGVGYRFFAVECDRNTESIERRNLNQSAFARKLVGYAAALRDQTYLSCWGVPNLHVLILTTNARHAQNILDAVRAHVDARFHSAFAVSTAQEFGADWRVPKDVLPVAFERPWRTVSGEKNVGVG